MSLAKVVPGGQAMIDGEMKKALGDMEKELHIKDDPHKMFKLPEEGWEPERVLEVMRGLKDAEEGRWKGGKVSGVVYHGGDEHTAMMNEALAMYSLSNPLHPDVFPSVRKYDAEIVAMTASFLNGGDEGVCGAVTSGGTESILMAVKAHRDFYRRTKGITRPELIMPNSAHAAFDKACHYFGIKMVKINCAADHRADVRAMENAVTPNTIMLVGSAPSYPHGLIDDIEALAAIAKRNDIGMHVDGCLGGFIVPFQRRLGYNIPPHDFGVPGVTSMSADTHKYGYAVKGTSVVLFRTQQLRKAMYFVITDWPGGIYASPSIAGSRPGALVAACWASLVKTGLNGFMENAKQITETQRAIKKGIPQIEGLELVGDSHTMVVSFRSSEFDVFMVSDVMSEKGWNLNAMQKPNALHLCCTFRHVGKADEFLSDLREAVARVRKDPAAFKDGAARIYGMAHGLPDRGIVNDIICGYLDVCLKV
eukprot:TRINITY_DN710_c0_g1_i1.p1 TRINITY_DN710_c0_g1~~TRINITY_DN710_c0_g1_i1.p1  ORF type:complete len:543 (+),score=218.16 TRINITY_DN710_c0_g1_i1:197-1630(+)